MIEQTLPRLPVESAPAHTIRDWKAMEKKWIPRGLPRCSPGRFYAWLAPWLLLLAIGAYAMYLCFAEGLQHTNMDNRFAFGLWIYLDLTVIALGAGAFFTGFLFYILRWKEMTAVINAAVVLGFICYSSAIAILLVDIGQPLRAWFTFWHPNVHSMLTEVTFCLSCYLTVLAIEYLPVLLKNRKLRQVPLFLVFEYELHRVMPVLAGVGTFLSFFHQGSLGGLYGVLHGRPFAFREALGIWPTTFFLFILSAAAAGPSFVLLMARLTQFLSRKQLVRAEVFAQLGKVSGTLLLFYVLLKTLDTMLWINRIYPQTGFSPYSFYAEPSFGTWVLLLEIIGLGLVPALFLVNPRMREKPWVLTLMAFLACSGVAFNRFVMTVQTLALPTLPFDRFLRYVPSWQEVAAFLAVLAYGVLLYSFSFRYATLFPQERDLRNQ